MPFITGTLTASGDSTTLIAAPTSPSCIAVWSLSVMGKNADIAVSIITGSTTQYSILLPASGVGGVCHPSGREPIFIGGAGELLKINLSGAAASGVAYNIYYTITS